MSSDEDYFIRVSHNSGFFSCCTVLLDYILNTFNSKKKLANYIDASLTFDWYKPENKRDQSIVFEYFEHYDNIQIPITWSKKIGFYTAIEIDNYSNIDYESITPFMLKYFTPSQQIKTIIQNIEEKYQVNYKNICVLFYRGNDKITETKLSSYDEYIRQANEVLEKNPNIQFLIQSDETEFIETMTKHFPSNSFYFKDEIRHIPKNNETTVDKVFSNLNFEFSKYFLAIMIIMSKCEHLIIGSGNCPLWICLYRGNTINTRQFLISGWVHES